MEQIVGATSTTGASASPPNMALVTVASPPVDTDAALVQVAFWTSCDNCGFRAEYQMEYRDCTIICPFCRDPFVAKETSQNSNIGRAAKRIRRSPKKDKWMVAKNVEALPHTGNVNVLGNFQPERGHSLPIGGHGAFLHQPRDKRKRQEPIKTLGANYKVSHDDCFENPPEPHEIQKVTSPEDVFTELIKIPDLAREDLLKAYNILRCDDFQFRSLMALPMEYRKEWLLMEIASK